MTTKKRTDLLTTLQMFHLDQACAVVSAGFGTHPFLVGSAGTDNDGGTYRDVDVRLILGDQEFAEVCPTRERWELLCLTISAYLSERSGVQVDFQIQAAGVANDRFSRENCPGSRNPLGMGRVFAGGGDGTLPWKPSPA